MPETRAAPARARSRDHAPLVGGKKAGAVSAQARAGSERRSSTRRAAQCAGAGCPPRWESAYKMRTRSGLRQKTGEPGPARGLVGGLKEVKWRTWRTKVGEAPSGASWRLGSGRRKAAGPQARGLGVPECGRPVRSALEVLGLRSRPPLRLLRPASPAGPSLAAAAVLAAVRPESPGGRRGRGPEALPPRSPARGRKGREARPGPRPRM